MDHETPTPKDSRYSLKKVKKFGRKLLRELWT
jgi:hypothetical protein